MGNINGDVKLHISGGNIKVTVDQPQNEGPRRNNLGASIRVYLVSGIK